MKTMRIPDRMLFGVAMAVGAAFSGMASEAYNREGASFTSVAPDRVQAVAAADVNPRLARLLKEASFSPGIIEVARLAEQGADTEMLLAHVRASDKAYQLRAEDMAHLKECAVPEVLMSAAVDPTAEAGISLGSQASNRHLCAGPRPRKAGRLHLNHHRPL